MMSSTNHRIRLAAVALGILGPAACVTGQDRVDVQPGPATSSALHTQGLELESPGSVAYTYDGAARKVSKTFSTPQSGVRAVHKVGPHLDVVEMDDGSLVMERYVTVNGARAVYIPDDAGGVAYYLHNDHLGSPRLETDSAGNVVRHFHYEPFGRDIALNNNLRHQFAGEEMSEGTVHLGGVRQYDPDLGRMMQADALVPDPKDPRSYNRYAYAYNDPLSYTDPSGYFVQAESTMGLSWTEQVGPPSPDPDALQFESERDFGEAFFGDAADTILSHTSQSWGQASLAAKQRIATHWRLYNATKLQPGDLNVDDVLLTAAPVVGAAGKAIIGKVATTAVPAAASLVSRLPFGARLGSHVAGRMAERGVSEKMVEMALRRG